MKNINELIKITTFSFALVAAFLAFAVIASLSGLGLDAIDTALIAAALTVATAAAASMDNATRQPETGRASVPNFPQTVTRQTTYQMVYVPSLTQEIWFRLEGNQMRVVMT